MALAMTDAAEVPLGLGKSLVACLVCRLVKTAEQVRAAGWARSSVCRSQSLPASRCHCRSLRLCLQFLQNGCENCHFLGMDGDRTRCEDCTTTYFSGIISVVEPSTSWTAKWLHLGVWAAALVCCPAPECHMLMRPCLPCRAVRPRLLCDQRPG